VTGLHAQPFWRTGPSTAAVAPEHDIFAWAAFLEEPEHFAILQGEVLAVSRASVSAAQSEGIHFGGGWSETHFIVKGKVVKGVTELFPKTMALLKQTGVQFVNVRLSVLAVATHISPHCGVSNTKLRAHLGLHVPLLSHTGNTLAVGQESTLNAGDGDGKSGALSQMRVGQQLVKWHEGQIIVFDDSFEHEVWWQWNARTGVAAAEVDSLNSSARVVLILDVFHPQLPVDMETAIRRSWG
jgi:aspartate beta-hydroxylase